MQMEAVRMVNPFPCQPAKGAKLPRTPCMAVPACFDGSDLSANISLFS